MKRIRILRLLVAHSSGQIHSTRILAGVNAQTSTSYSFVASDVTHLTTFSNASAIAVTLPAGTTVGFGIGATFSTQNVGAGTVTVTCSSCTINGAGTLVLTQNQGAHIYSGGSNYSAVVWGTNIFANAGVFTGAMFTDTQMNQYVTSAVNGINFTTEFVASQGSHSATEGITAGVAVPSTSTVHQANGVAGYVNNSSGSTHAVAGYFQSRCLVNNTHCWGANLVSRDVAGLTSGITLYGLETDVNPLNALSAYSNIYGDAEILDTTQTGNYGTAFIAQTNEAGLLWEQGFATQSGHVNVAISVGAAPVPLDPADRSQSTLTRSIQVFQCLEEWP